MEVEIATSLRGGGVKILKTNVQKGFEGGGVEGTLPSSSSDLGYILHTHMYISSVLVLTLNVKYENRIQIYTKNFILLIFEFQRFKNLTHTSPDFIYSIAVQLLLY